MNITTLTAISPIDGRYRNKTDELAGYFSEYALIKYRIQVEIEYFIELCVLPLPQLAGFDKKYFLYGIIISVSTQTLSPGSILHGSISFSPSKVFCSPSSL